MKDTTNKMNFLLTTPQGSVLEPEKFQATLIASMTHALLRTNPPPCLLRAPTGSGKTFMLARVLANVSSETNVIWFWFVPFVNLVAQTLDALVSNSADLTPLLLVHGRNQDAASGQVLISTVQAVAKAQWRNKGYNADGDDDTRTLAELVALARSKGLRIGMVVDEAHIALDKTTEFGKFAHWLNPDYLIMATATPKDQRLLEFLAGAGKSEFESFTVSRDDVVAARLNKRYIEAVVYDLRQSVQNVADLKRTVLRQAWKRNQKLKHDLANNGIPLTPLLLVQVGNGEKTVEEAEYDLAHLCKVPPHAIGKHSADEPDPVLMAAIANDRTKEVLIFKQSAGTGFDAPRAFVLASTKPVNDPDFAMQFIGRVMRISQAIRTSYSRSQPIPPDFDTAYVYLANAEAQRGFEAAVQATSQIKSQLEGQTEKMALRQTVSGATVITNKPSQQASLIYDLPLPIYNNDNEVQQLDSDKVKTIDGQQSLFDGENNGDFLDVMVPEVKLAKKEVTKPSSEKDLQEALQERSLVAYPRSTKVRNLPKALKREDRPLMLDMTSLSRMVATRLDIPAKLLEDATKVAQNKLKEIERHTELTTKNSHDEAVLLVTDRNALAKEAIQALRNLPQVEDEDIRAILDVLCQRMLPSLQQIVDDLGGEVKHDEKSVIHMARDAANWVAKQQADRLAEAMHEAISSRAEIIEAGPLPDAMVFPADLPLAASRKNIYGVFPPNADELSKIDQLLMISEREWLKERSWEFSGKTFLTGQYDSSSTLNGEEKIFANSLDRSEFVEWWHRNPDRKSYSVKLVRGEHRNFFYPDFVVCLEHYPGDEPLLRLVETKDSVKDAARKARHVPSYYGKVLFLTKDNQRFRWVKDDGSLGEDIDMDDLSSLREWLLSTRPIQK